MRQNPMYKTVCDQCGQGTWYETEQQCHRAYPESKVCNLGHTHYSETHKRCKGTLRIIMEDDLNPLLTPFYERDERVEIEYQDGFKERFWIGKSTGWRPCYTMLSRRDSRYGPAIPAKIEELKSIRAVARK